MKAEKAKKGRPSKYDEETVMVPFRCPKSKRNEFRKHGNAKLKTWETPKDK